ncbi:MAG TPA: class 1 fructose-bisphosphatase [Methylibium sp.]|uniref:class 1 fructose-bisphosphatase n=1 Tax=Methylibium sp. TaxID=2067992 RepID=UPI002DBEFC5E|nr:class 1 fructose-bisphosphatase [Methylibium sp.]HEU4458391.1 class 1 fructose-bisphosphatase [Methylibium sp.]
MPLSQRWTLTRYLIEERRRFPQASGDLNGLILDASIACKALARIVSFGALGEGAAAAGLRTQDGDPPQALHLLGHEIFVRMNDWNGHLAGMASGEALGLVQIPPGHARGKYLLVFNAIDGTANLDVNVSVGSIFSILRAPADAITNGRDACEADFLQAGATQVAAGYALYGPTTMFVLTVGNGVAGFTLNPNLGEFVLTHPNIQVPDDTQEFAINSSNSRFWEPPVKRYVDECMAGRTGPRGKDFNMRWIASTVAEAHRILMRGGVFLDPRDTQETNRSGRLRLLHEAGPIGFVMEQAGGRASTGRQPVLGVTPSTMQQTVGCIFGSKNEVERIERYHREPDAREHPTPLFGERSLFRA